MYKRQIPLTLFFKSLRRNLPFLFVLSIFVNIGMWFERFVIIVGGVAHGFMPHSWGLYKPTGIEFGIMLGSFCLFFFLFVLFVKHLPSVSMAELKEMVSAGSEHEHGT